MRASLKNRGLHHARYAYPLSRFQIGYSNILPIVLVCAIFFILAKFTDIPFHSDLPISITTLMEALVATFIRLLVAYVFALVTGIVLAFIVHANKTAEAILFPFFDIIQSIPVLAFFPIVVAFFIKLGMYNAAAVFIIFLSMLWNIVFSLVGGLKVIPEDVLSVARVFNVSSWRYHTSVW